MIGDSLEADVYGAINFGMDAIYINPSNAPKPDDVPEQVTHLKELTLILHLARIIVSYQIFASFVNPLCALW